MLDRFLENAPRIILTDGGIETTLIFDDGIDLPHFAAFKLLDDDTGRAALASYYERHIEVARRVGSGFILESPTWRASPDWAALLGYDRARLAEANGRAISLMHDLRTKHQRPALPMLVSGCVGPRGDGYVANAVMTPDEAATYHRDQIAAFKDARVDVVTAITMTNTAEAIGIARAAAAHGLDCVVSFTVETDGRLPTGQALEEAIQETDRATSSYPKYYMVNCAHPTHFDGVLEPGAAWAERLGGIRANASCKSHAELNESTELDRGDPEDLGRRYQALLARHRHLRVLGGCCGTDHTHIAAIAAACV